MCDFVGPCSYIMAEQTSIAHCFTPARLTSTVHYLYCHTVLQRDVHQLVSSLALPLILRQKECTKTEEMCIVLKPGTRVLICYFICSLKEYLTQTIHTSHPHR